MNYSMHGFTKWFDGPCPVVAGTVVQLIHRAGRTNERVIDYPTEWGHLGTPCDIVAYKIIKRSNARIKPTRNAGIGN